ncbi:gluconate transporter [Solitalea longa]|uniref:Gluconate transporter n=1 Tax=Solitalea longa TaxID=2079460 RepID=A0A2S4ZYF4_9SPHI|nr:gluconate:H+ symporter [Solitalea longa]POY35390.1 gluconate transporter [Solitalea longa]
MSVLILIACIVFLILQITVLKVNPFLAFIITSIIAGLLLGLPISTLPQTIEKGMGDMLGAISLVIIFGTCIGKLTVSSGAANVIAKTIMNWTGPKYVRLGLMTTGFIVGIPLFYSVGFVLLIPLIFSIAYQLKLPKVYLGIPMLASLSVAHGFLPPHPSPMALSKMFNANIGMVLIYGILIAIPTILIAGLLFSNFFKNIKENASNEIVKVEEFVNGNMQPGFAVSILSSLFPVFGLTITSLLPLIWKDPLLIAVCKTLGSPSSIMLVSLLICTYTLGIRSGKSLKMVMDDYAVAIKDVAMIIFIVGGAGCLKEVMSVSGVSQSIVQYLIQLDIHPYLLAWVMAAIIRVCIGSATAAGLMTAGVLLPLLQVNGIDPNLLVLSIGAGSLMCSHVNDPSFWMFKEYFNISMKDTFKTWTVMESLVSVLGITFIFIVNFIIQK